MYKISALFAYQKQLCRTSCVLYIRGTSVSISMVMMVFRRAQYVRMNVYYSFLSFVCTRILEFQERISVQCRIRMCSTRTKKLRWSNLLNNRYKTRSNQIL